MRLKSRTLYLQIVPKFVLVLVRSAWFLTPQTVRGGVCVSQTQTALRTMSDGNRARWGYETKDASQHIVVQWGRHIVLVSFRMFAVLGWGTKGMRGRAVRV